MCVRGGGVTVLHIFVFYFLLFLQEFSLKVVIITNLGQRQISA